MLTGFYKDIMGESIKILAKFKINNTTLPFTHQAIYTTVESISLVRHDFPFIKPCWLLQIMFSSFMCLEMVSRIIFPFIFPEVEIRLISLQFLLALVDYEWFFFPVFRNVFQLLLPFKDNKCVLKMTMANPLSLLRCIPIGPWNYTCPTYTCQMLYSLTLLHWGCHLF